MYELILASKSPRRRQLLAEAGYQFRVDTVKVSEIIDENLNVDEAIQTIAQDKAEAYLQHHNELKSQGFLILSADTVVVVDERILGKPESFVQAKEFLRLLSGREHCVKTAVCLLSTDTQRAATFVETTKVSFRDLTDEEIEAYVQSGEPMDKAGAYAIQGEGAKLVQETRGSWSNVVGLPLERLEIVLQEKGWNVSRESNSASETTD